MKANFGNFMTTKKIRIEIKEFLKANSKSILMMGLVLAPSIAFSSTTSGSAGDKAFGEVFSFIHDAATGNLGKAIAVSGGVVGLIMGAGTGKIMPAITGGVLAICAVMIPKVIDSVFASAII